MKLQFDATDILGKRFGRLIIESCNGRVKRGKSFVWEYHAKCDCGNECDVVRSSVLKGDTTSCGCAHKLAGRRRTEDLSGKKFGRWTVIKQAPTRYSKSGSTRSIMWECQCDCGTVKVVGARALKTGMSQSCGCLQKERAGMSATDDLTGQRFGMLQVIEKAESRKGSDGYRRQAMWRCKCDCGGEVTTFGFSLKNGDCTSCGCRKTSKYEDMVDEWLQSHGFILNETYFREKTYADLVGPRGGDLRLDFVVVTKSKIFWVECQGEQHFKPVKWFGGREYFERLKEADKLKQDYAREHDITLIEILPKDTESSIADKLRVLSTKSPTRWIKSSKGTQVTSCS